MVEPVKSRERAAAWRPWTAAGRRPVPQWLGHWPVSFWPAPAQQLRAWALAETGPGRLVPWLPVAFGFGIVVYFTAEREPALWAALTLLAGAVAAAVALRGTGRSLSRRAWPCRDRGRLRNRDRQDARASRIRCLRRRPGTPTSPASSKCARSASAPTASSCACTRIAGPRLNETLERVRVSVRKGTAPPVGSFVEFKARLSPPLAPLRPGGYDFARDLYFQGIGASGFVLGRIRAGRSRTRRRARGCAMPPSSTACARRSTTRIRAVVPGDAGAIASALITGKRDAISAPVNDAMYVSGLGHVLSISGYHMAVVAGVVFFVLRAPFALMPAFAGRHPDQEMGGRSRRCARRRSICCCRAPRSRPSAPSS